MVLHFLTNKTARLLHLDTRQKFAEELENTLQAQVLRKYLILSS